MRDQLRAELLKARSGRTPAVLLGTNAGLVALGALGEGSLLKTRLASHATDVATASHTLIQFGIGGLILATLFGAVLVTGEYRDGAIGRSVLLARNRDHLLAAKGVVAALAGVLHGLVGVATALATGAAVLAHQHQRLVLDRESWIICAGVVAACALAGPWGAFLGWIGRHQLATVAAILVYLLLVEAQILRLLPQLGRFLPGGAQAAIYRDTSNAHLFPAPVAVALFAGWLLAAGLLARRLVATRDLT